MKWISVKDKMPSIGELCLTTNKEEYCIKVYRFGILEHFTCENCSIDHESVTHWMPLPEKPE